MLIFSVFVNAQSFRSGFDLRDFSSSGGNGQGASYHSNVASKLHNDESVFLIGYMNMFVATHDKKYLNRNWIRFTNQKDTCHVLTKHHIMLRPAATYLINDKFDAYNFSFAFEAQYGYKISKHILVEFGFSYENLRSFKLLSLYGPGLALLNRNIFDSYKLISFPVRVNYFYRLHPFTLSAGFGGVYSILMYHQTHYFDELFDGYEVLYNKGDISILSSINIQLSYSFGERFSIGLNAEYRNAIKPLIYESVTTNGDKIVNKFYLSYFVPGCNLLYNF